MQVGYAAADRIRDWTNPSQQWAAPEAYAATKDVARGAAGCFGRDVDVPANLRYSRKLYVTFLDDELMIMRDESGVPDVLLRKGAPEGAPTVDEGVPSTDDEDAAPGA